MFKNTNVADLINDQRGSISIEFFFSLVLIMLLIFFTIDLTQQQNKVGKLDRISYSTAGTLRERTQLYNSKEDIKQADVQELLSLARAMAKNMGLAQDKTPFAMYVEQIFFKYASTNSPNTRIIDYGRSGDFQVGDRSLQCRSKKPLSKEATLSPYSRHGRWVTLYKVTVCMPVSSPFSKMTHLGRDTVNLSSSSVVMSR